MQKRFFLGVPVPAKVGKSLYSLASQLAKDEALSHFRWHTIDKYHLTLSFVGSLDEKLIKKVSVSLTEALKDSVRPIVQITEIDWFPRHSKSRLLVALVEQKAELITLQKLVNKVLENEGITTDIRPYLPHITLGRGRQPTSKVLLPPKNSPSQYLVESILGYETRATELGSEYVSLFEVPLLKSKP